MTKKKWPQTIDTTRLEPIFLNKKKDTFSYKKILPKIEADYLIKKVSLSSNVAFLKYETLPIGL